MAVAKLSVSKGMFSETICKRSSQYAKGRCQGALLIHDFMVKECWRFQVCRILPDYTGLYCYTHFLAKPNSKDLQESRAPNYFDWVLACDSSRQTPKAHQQTHTCLDEPRLAFKRVPLPLGGTYTLLIFLSLSFTWRAMVHEFSAWCLFWLILLEHTILYHLLGVTPGQQLAAKSCQVWDMQLHSGDFLLVCTRNAEC